MDRLAGFRYREVVRRLKNMDFEFGRQAAGSHVIWVKPTTRRYSTIPNHPGDVPEGTPGARPASTPDGPGAPRHGTVTDLSVAVQCDGHVGSAQYRPVQRGSG